MSQNRVNIDFPKYFDTFVFFLESEHAPKSEYPIYFGNSKKTQPYVFMNTEQLTRKRVLDNIIKINKDNKPFEIWDYSWKNCEILAQNGIIAKHVPLQSPKWYLEKLKAWRTTISYDVGFSGTLTSRRLTILNQLKERGLKVNTVCKWGEERDKELATCRIIINIHAGDDYQIFEVARCEPWLAIGVPVISENSLDNDPRCMNVEYTALVEKVLSVHCDTII
jgi:hypothetical protein